MSNPETHGRLDRRGRLGRGARMKVVVSVLLVLGTLLATVAADRLVGLFIEKPLDAAGLIFPPGSALTYQTPEFSFTANINRLGFRDREFTLTKEAGARILAVGDSFTYGWGVSVEQSWPKALEARLRERGYDVEVANLGQPGGSPLAYAQTAARAVPLLKPDLVIVCITQGDDLAQLKGVGESSSPPGRPVAAEREMSGDSRPGAASRLEAAASCWGCGGLTFGVLKPRCAAFHAFMGKAPDS